MTIKILGLCFVLALLNLRAFAQASDNIDYVKKSEKFRRMRNWGIGLTAVGTTLFVVGSVIIMESSVDELFYTESKTADAGAASTMIGGVCLGGGIPLWIIGHNNHKKYSKLSQGLTVKINSTPRSCGLTLTYHF